jgi:hypothetical protein
VVGCVLELLPTLLNVCWNPSERLRSYGVRLKMLPVDSLEIFKEHGAAPGEIAPRSFVGRMRS